MAGQRRGRSEVRIAGLALLFLVVAPAVVRAFDYNEAMSKTLLFFEAQRSGPLPPGSDRVPWRGSSGLSDGSLAGVDLTGGYYDAGDNVKFGFAMAFSMTLLSWSVVEDAMSSAGELQNALNAVRWGTDWFLKAYQGPTTLYAQVGDGNSDHACWERPETMDTPRTVYKIDQSKPGSDYAGETAAALAAASIAFKSADPSYSATLLDNAKQLFQFADQYRAKYSDSIPEVQNFYNSFSGYNDELLWAAAWLHRATGDATYLNYVDTNAQSLNGLGSISEFSWDNKLAGAQILIARQTLHCGASSQNLKQMRQMAEQYVCAYVNGGVTSTPDGLAWVRQWAPLQYSNNAAFVTAVYSDYLAEAGQSLTCGGKTFTPDQIMAWSQSQVDYVLGKNNAGRSFMVGFGDNYPLRMHHRGASVPVTPTPYSCGEGYGLFYNTQNPDPNLITGAIAGGPAQDGSYADDRSRYEQSEPIMYINAGFMGAVARVARGSAGVSGACTAAGGGGSNPPPTTQSPTTQAPATPSPTQSPATSSPTQSPTTPSPTQSSPSSDSPTSSPTTPSPTQSSPSTDSPTSSPTTPSPTSSSPSTDSPTSSPTTPSPTQSSPSTQSPGTSSPTQSPPSTDSPTSSPTQSPPSETGSPTGSPSQTSSPSQDASSPTPSTSSPTPSTSSPTPSTSSPTPSTSSPTPSTSSPTPSASSPTPSTSSPTPSGSGASFTVTSTENSSWTSSGGQVTLYTVVIKNVSGQTFNNVAVTCNNFHPDQYWNLLKGGSDGECAVPTWMSSFAPGATLTFGYIQGGSGAQFSVNL